MIKLLHSADWHLDAPMQLHEPHQAQALRAALKSVPARLSAICRSQSCDLVLLSGDLFDGPATGEGLQLLSQALEEMSVPVFISPGNHDHLGPRSPWLQQQWPENVYIFTQPQLQSVALPQLDCRVYGAGYTAMDCPGLLEGFAASQPERYALGVLHGDPTQVHSPYCPITVAQVTDSGLDYLALGHIHKAGSFRAGRTLCAWPGCPMGRGYDETGEKGVYIVTLEESGAQLQFLPLDLPRFYDLQVPAQTGLDAVLPAVGNGDFYRITLTGACQPPQLDRLRRAYAHFPNLTLRDRTVPPVELWSTAGQDTFEGTYFHLLRAALENATGEDAQRIQLAARISRQLLDGQEVELP